jgi:hypothetical protein
MTVRGACAENYGLQTDVKLSGLSQLQMQAQDANEVALAPSTTILNVGTNDVEWVLRHRAGSALGAGCGPTSISLLRVLPLAERCDSPGQPRRHQARLLRHERGKLRLSRRPDAVGNVTRQLRRHLLDRQQFGSVLLRATDGAHCAQRWLEIVWLLLRHTGSQHQSTGRCPQHERPHRRFHFPAEGAQIRAADSRPDSDRHSCSRPIPHRSPIRGEARCESVEQFRLETGSDRSGPAALSPSHRSPRHRL